MSHPHPLGVLAPSQSMIEAVGTEFLVDGLIKARQKTQSALQGICGILKEGMTEDEARVAVLKYFQELGVKKHWHKPYIRFGAGTTLTFNDPLQPEYRLRQGDPYYIDLGPVWTDPELGIEYEGDYGDTFVLGENEESTKCAKTARSLFQEAKMHWSQAKVSGEQLYQFLDRRASELGYELVKEVEGHRLADFPHHRYSKQCLAQVPFVPSNSLWVLEIQINDPQKRFGAFFEDLL